MDDAYQETPSQSVPGAPKPDIAPERKADVKQWLEKIKSAKAHLKKKHFDRMRENQQLAKDGCDSVWKESKQVVVPILNRHINMAVAQLYAKDPRATAKPRKKLMFTLWDGDPQTLQAAMNAAMPPPIVDPHTGAPMIDQMTGQPVPSAPPDPNAMALLREVQQVKQYEATRKKIGKTLELLWKYYTGEQANGFKQEMKALVRRAKVNGVAYVELMYQRTLEKNPDVTAQISDVTAPVANIEAKLKAMADGRIPDGSADLDELNLLLQNLQDKEMLLVRDGPVFGWPRSDEVIYDLDCLHLKTLAGADWWAREFHMTPQQVMEVYKVDITGEFTEYKPTAMSNAVRDSRSGEYKKNNKSMACVYKVQCKSLGAEFVVIDGYCDFVVEPAAPAIKIERFFTLYPLVFNEIEHDEQIPPSDVELAKDSQAEYNRSRQGLKEHRSASRPTYVTPKGMLEEKDRANLADRPAHGIVELANLNVGEDIKSKFQQLPVINIDPNMYEVKMFFDDLLRSVGSQEANLGPNSGGTATESSIAENSRMSTQSDNVDDLDDMLTELAKGFGQLCLMEVSKDTVLEIVGPGAVWPDMPESRQGVAKDLMLEIKAGSSGRPNRAAELANMERGMPYLLQMPGINPTVLVEKYCDLLDIDVEDLILEGLPSITAMNAMASKPPPPPGGAGPGDPNAQGPQGGDNGAKPAQNEAGPQPAHPAPQPGPAG